MLPVDEFALYGKALNGTETELERAKLARCRYLKTKMRRRLTLDIGDDPDNLTDVLRAAIIAYAVLAGKVTDQGIVDRLDAYMAQAMAAYGGPEGIMDTLEIGLARVGAHVVQGYFAAKARIEAAETEEEVMGIDLDNDGEPEAQG